MGLPRRIEFIEVGTRDGLQSAKADVATDDKVRLVDALVQTGVPRIEVTSFVSPKAVPQLADGEEVYRRVRKDMPARYRVLIPNLRGLERALAVGAANVLVNVGATDGFNRANLNRSMEETLAEIAQVVARAKQHGVTVDASLSVAFGCPYEGTVPPERVLGLCRRLAALGIGEISLGDTVGYAHPRQVSELFSPLRRELPGVRWGAHFHDTRGLGLANALAALEAGVTIFEGCVGGVGGCPFAPGATGNVCSEDLLYMFEQMGIETGVDLDKLVEAARMMERLLGHELPGKLKQAGRPRGSTGSPRTG